MSLDMHLDHKSHNLALLIIALLGLTAGRFDDAGGFWVEMTDDVRGCMWGSQEQ